MDSVSYLHRPSCRGPRWDRPHRAVPHNCMSLHASACHRRGRQPGVAGGIPILVQCEPACCRPRRASHTSLPESGRVGRCCCLLFTPVAARRELCAWTSENVSSRRVAACREFVFHKTVLTTPSSGGTASVSPNSLLHNQLQRVCENRELRRAEHPIVQGLLVYFSSSSSSSPIPLPRRRASHSV